jgi:peptidoglycan/LPS O-acetylase OafA/YrhL
LYIYGFPVQQSLAALAGGGMSVAANLFGAIALAGLLAVLSWHLLESRALALAHRGIGLKHLRRNSIPTR